MVLGRWTIVLIVVAAVAGALAVATLPAPAAASTAVLRLIDGGATVEGGGAARAAADGEVVPTGASVTTGADGYALLTFADGSTTSLEPDTTVVVDEAAVHPATTVTRLEQRAGRTWSSVRPLRPGSRFVVRTAAASVEVRGTVFGIDVAADGTTRIRSADGTVRVANGAGTVDVAAGSATTVARGAAPGSPEPVSSVRAFDLRETPLVRDAHGRACGERDVVVEQIPGCVVRDGTIVVDGTIDITPVPAASARAVPVVIPTPLVTAAPTLRIAVPFIGPIPVQLTQPTSVPTPTPTAAPTLRVTAPPTLPPLSPLPRLSPLISPLLSPTLSPPLRLP